MIFKSSIVSVADKSGALLCNTFHLYKGGFRKVAYVGYFTKVSLIKCVVDSSLKKKKKSIFLVSSTKKSFSAKDGSLPILYSNNGILIKRKLVLRSKEIIRPSYKSINRRKLQYKFPGIL